MIIIDTRVVRRREDETFKDVKVKFRVLRQQTFFTLTITREFELFKFSNDEINQTKLTGMLCECCFRNCSSFV